VPRFFPWPGKTARSSVVGSELAGLGACDGAAGGGVEGGFETPGCSGAMPGMATPSRVAFSEAIGGGCDDE
jgi:hypothetical protein